MSKKYSLLLVAALLALPAVPAFGSEKAQSLFAQRRHQRI